MKFFNKKPKKEEPSREESYCKFCKSKNVHVLFWIKSSGVFNWNEPHRAFCIECGKVTVWIYDAGKLVAWNKEESQ